jgi:signal peptidase
VALRPSVWWRRIGTVASWTVGILATLLAVAVWPQEYGGTTSVTVVSGQSMEPTYHSGDLLLTRRHAYQVGEVVVYEVPADQPGAGHRVVHRIIGGDGRTGWRTQGDNNAAPDIWTPRDPDVVGCVVVHVPKLGLLLMQLRNPITWALVGGLVIGRMLWPSAPERDDAVPTDPTPVAVGGPPDPEPSPRAEPDPSDAASATNR